MFMRSSTFNCFNCPMVVEPLYASAGAEQMQIARSAAAVPSIARSGRVQVPALMGPIDVIVVATGYFHQPSYVTSAPHRSAWFLNGLQTALRIPLAAIGKNP